MATERNRAILVTGSPRSGSTWVGRMIAAHPRVHYVSEPFNTDHAGCPSEFRFPYVAGHNEAAFRQYLRPQIEFRSGLLRACLEPVRAAKRFVRRVTGERPLLKDPHAVFSADWLARNYPLDVVVLVRHPAAFVGSMKRLGRGFAFQHQLRQPHLMKDLLGPYEDDMRRLSERPASVVESSTLMWRVVYGTLLRYRSERPDWVFVRHEDLSQNPFTEFGRLLERLGLDLSPSVVTALTEHTSASNPREVRSGEMHQLRRDSRANLWNWRERLTEEEIEFVRRETDDVARHYYTESDWRETLSREPQESVARLPAARGRIG